MPRVLCELVDEVALITLNDPDRLNAMGEAMAREFEEHVEGLRGQRLRAVILTGAGRAFSAGGDLEMLTERRQVKVEDNRRHMLAFYRSFLSVLDLDVPVVAAVNGLAVGAGLCLVCACDIRMADLTARFSAPFLRLGLFPGMGATYFVPRVVGPHASDLLLTGRSLDAHEAQTIGLVTRVCEPGGVVAMARAMCAHLLEGAPSAGRDLLRALRGPREGLQSALQKEAEAQAQSYARPEFAQGLARALAAVGGVRRETGD